MLRSVFFRCWLPLVLIFLPAAATSQDSLSLSGRKAQYVFIVDDSGSMSGQDGPASDPDRLAVFAVRSVINLLESSDEATVVRLNGPREGKTPPSMAPLSPDHRSRLLQGLDMQSEMARYAGQYTPCRSALETTKELLNAAYQEGVPQIVMFLTDGECTPRQSPAPREVPDPQVFLRGLRSHKDGQFRFYLLRFRGRRYTQELQQLASRTQGQTLEVSIEDATRLVEPFADALTRSQGYEAEVLTPSFSRLPSYAGARRVRLLAVAKGEGPALEFEVSSSGGPPPQLRKMGEGKGTHRYKDGGSYRFAAVSYRPERAEIRVQVKGAGSAWKVVAVPEYRLSVELELRAGRCAQPGPVVDRNIETGSAVCAQLRLVDETGRPVPRRLTGGQVDARILWQLSEEAKDTLQERRRASLPTEPSGEDAVFTLERINLEPGTHVYQGFVKLPLGGSETEAVLVDRQRALQVTSVTVKPRPASVEFGEELLPGGVLAEPRLQFVGNFPPTRVRLEVVERQSLPSCVTFTLGGQNEGTPLDLTAEQPYALRIRMAPYCGPRSFERQQTVTLRLTLDRAAGGPAVSAVDVPVTFRMSHQIEAPSELVVEVPAGERAEVRVSLRSNQVRPQKLKSKLQPPDERVHWPRGDLHLYLAVPKGEPGDEQAFELHSDRTSPLVLEVEAGTCCAGGTYETSLGLIAAEGEYAGGRRADALGIPIRVVVEGASTWACWGSTVWWGLGILLILLILLYLLSMWRHTRLFKRDRLADSLIPLRWDEYGEAVVHRHRLLQQEIRRKVSQEMGWLARTKAWLWANPLVFGLPGRSYKETVEVSLQPETRPRLSRVRLLEERDHYERLLEKPEQGRSQLFAAAQGGGGLLFYGVPNHGKLGRLTVERLADAGGWGWEQEADETIKLRVEKLRRRERLVYQAEGEKSEGQGAGWEIQAG